MSQASPATPAIIAKAARGGRGARGAFQYTSCKAGAELLHTNLAGTTAREWARQIAVYRALAPRCTRPVDHWSLSLDPRLGQLTPVRWRALIDHWLAEMGYGDRAVVVHRHTDEPHDHVHLVVCRIDTRGRVHGDGNNWHRSHACAARAADAIGLRPLPSGPEVTITEKARRAERRSLRHSERALRRDPRGTPAVLDAVAIATTLRQEVARTASADELVAACRAAGIELDIVRQSSGLVQGVRVRLIGGETWLKGSELSRSRDLSWLRIAQRLDANAELRAGARERVKQLAADAIAEEGRATQRRPPSSPRTKSETPASKVEKEQSEMSMPVERAHDPLAFLPVPVGPIAATRPGSALDRDNAVLIDQGADNRMTEAEAAYAEAWALLRDLTDKELIAVESRSRDLPLVGLAEETWWKLLRLVIKFVSLGTVDIGMSDAGRKRAAARELGRMAREELDRRRTGAESDPLTVRVAQLHSEETALVEHRSAIADYLPRWSDRAARERATVSLTRHYDTQMGAEGQPTLGNLCGAVSVAQRDFTAFRSAAPQGWLAGIVGSRRAHAEALEAARQRLAAARRRVAEAEARIQQHVDTSPAVLDAQERRAMLKAELQLLDQRIADVRAHRVAMERNAESAAQRERAALQRVVQDSPLRDNGADCADDEAPDEARERPRG